MAELHDLAGMFKVGLELFCSHGPRAVEAVLEQGGLVFLDLKYHDIPNTVAGAARAAVRMGVSMFNVHIGGGAEMMKAALDAARQEAGSEAMPKVLGVTVLTSLGAAQLRDEVGLVRSPAEQVVFWAKQARDCGLSGVVASPREIETNPPALWRRLLDRDAGNSSGRSRSRTIRSGSARRARHSAPAPTTWW